MTTIIIRYFEQIKDPASSAITLVPLGTETLESISEALLPSVSGHKVFCIKKFTNVANYRWYVESVLRLSDLGVKPAEYVVTLSKLFQSLVAEEYLQQTLTKTKQSLPSLIYPSTLVDVEYGFIQAVAREDGELRTNKRYCDTLQKGEMHKRRLAVVIRAAKGVVQVAPVTSEAPAAGDKTCFQLSRDTLDQLATWGGSGKDSWVLTGMIETVSTSRILPPVSYYTVGQRKRSGRSTHYKLRLTADEKQDLKTSLAHSVGITDYPQIKASLSDAKQQLAAVPEMAANLAAAVAKNAALEAMVSELRLVEEVAKDWAKGMGDNSLAERVDDLRRLYAEIGDEAPVSATGGYSA